MYKKCLPMQLLVVTFLLLKNIKTEELRGYNLFGTQTTENGVINNNLQARLQAYYYGIHTNQRNQPGYNYNAPASTSSDHFTLSQTTQTSPLAVSLQPDDFTQFDKTTEIFFLPRVKSLEPKSNIKEQQKFYISRNAASQNKFEIQNTETKAATEHLNPSQDGKTKTITEGLHRQPDSKFRVLPLETQQNWRPMPQQQKFQNTLSPFLTEVPLNAVSGQERESINTDFKQYNQGSSTNSKLNLTNFHFYSSNKELPLDCQRHLSNLQNRETELRSLSPTQSQGADEATPFPRQKTPVAVGLPNFESSGATSRNLPTSNSLNAFNHKRLNIIKSLLAEYLALIQSNVPSASQRPQASLNNDVAGENGIDNRFSTEGQAQFPAYSPTGLQSPAVNKFIDANQYQNQQYFQTRPIISAIRKPHSVYGTPFVDGPNPISKK